MSRSVSFNRTKVLKEKLPTKIVVRRLPPNFTKDVFKSQVSPIPKHNYLYFVRANEGNEPHAFSRAYINFVYYEDVLMFKEKFDNYVFLGSNGAEYPAVVEYAPFQNLPKDSSLRRKDVKCDTIQYDNYYLNFVDSVTRKGKYERAEFDYHIRTESRDEGMTPLLKYILERKSDKRTSSEKDCASRNAARNKTFENCIVFVNSSVKKNQRFYLRNGHRKPKFVNSYN